jgi:hypothetical protein
MTDDYAPTRGLYTDNDGKVAVLVQSWEVDSNRSGEVGAAQGEKVYRFIGALPCDSTVYYMPEGEFLSKYPHRIDGIRIDEDEASPLVKKVDRKKRRHHRRLRRERIGRLVQAIEKGGGSVRARFEVNGDVWNVRGTFPGDGDPRIEYEGTTVILSMDAATIEESVRVRKG